MPSAAVLEERKRLNAYIPAKRYNDLEKVFTKHGLKMSEAARIGLNLFAAALPTLASEGEIVLRSKDGVERVYMFPF